MEEELTKAKSSNDNSQVRNIVHDQAAMAQNLMASIAFSQTVMVSLPMMAEIAQMTVIAIHQTYRNGFHFYESRKGPNYVEGCNSQQIDRNCFYSYENRNGFASSRNGLFPSQGHIGYHQGRNGYAQTFNNPSATCRQNYGNQPNYNYSGQNTPNEHGWAAANQQGNSNSFISGCEEPKPRLPIFTGKGDWKSFFLQFELLADRYNWSMDRKREEIIFCLKDEALSFVSQLSVEVRNE